MVYGCEFLHPVWKLHYHLSFNYRSKLLEFPELYLSSEDRKKFLDHPYHLLSLEVDVLLEVDKCQLPNSEGGKDAPRTFFWSSELR